MKPEMESRSANDIVRAGLDHIDQGISVFDEDLRLVFCNRRYLDLLELPDELAVVGSPYAAFVRYNAERGEYGPGAIEDQVTRRVESARNFIAHYQEQARPNGMILAIHGVPLPEGGFISVYSDITEQQQAEELIRERNEELEARVRRRTQELQAANEKLRDLIRSEQHIAEALRNSEARLRLITDAVPAGIAYVDAEQRYQFANQRIAKAFGYEKDEILGKTIKEVLGDAMYDRLIPYLTQGQEGQGVTFEYLHELPDGRDAQVRTNVIPDLEEDGAIRGYYVLSLDVSDQKKAEVALAHAQKMEAVAQLSGGLAHDFNNLLTIVLGNLLPLRERYQGKGQELELVDPAIRAARRGTGLIRRLLSFSRQETLEPLSVDVAALIDNLVTMLKNTLPPDIEIVEAADDANLLAFVDPHQLENVLLNLCFNARDAMAEGGRLQIRTRSETVTEEQPSHADLRPGRYIAISVVDDGCGIEPASLNRVFEPFFTLKAPGKGSGLGLSMVYGFAQQSGGAVLIDSELGRGTTVELFLPHIEDAAEPADGATAENATDGGPGADKPLVLLVDDDKDVREVVRRQLIELGCLTIEASDADQALELLDNVEEIAVLISDVVMPGSMNGHALAKRARERRPGLKILLMSAHTDARSGDGARGPFPLLRKPFGSDALRRALGRQSAERSAAP